MQDYQAAAIFWGLEFLLWAWFNWSLFQLALRGSYAHANNP
jgi:hypothetical protein